MTGTIPQKQLSKFEYIDEQWPAIFDGRRTIEQEVARTIAGMSPKNLPKRDVFIRLHLIANTYLAWGMYHSGLYEVPAGFNNRMISLMTYLGHGVTPDELKPIADELTKQLPA